MTPQDISYMTALFQTLSDHQRQIKEDVQVLTWHVGINEHTHQLFKEMYEQLIKSRDF